MYIQQLYTNCLSEAAYYVESDGEAAIIDPLRDIAPYIALAEQRNATIKYVFETHFHADFVSGHIDLGKACNAPIVFGPNTITDYLIKVAKDEEIFTLGKISFTALHTPGHTLESTCWLLKDEHGREHAIFTGDTLFIGDVGRPDLSSGNLTSDELAAMLYHSLQNRIIPLADDVLVYPAHGAGSACGKNLSSETFSTIGEQKRSNYALKSQSKEDFIKAVTEGLAEAPSYFSINAKINKQGYQSLETVLKQGMTALSIIEFEAAMNSKDVVVVDTRPPAEFALGFIPGAVGIGLDGRFAEWAGGLLPFDKPILLVTEPGKEEESIIRLARVGFDKMVGYLEGSFTKWTNASRNFDLIIDVETDELVMDIPYDPKLVIVDVRNESEFAGGHVEGAINLPLKDMNDPAEIAMLPEGSNLYVHCAGGYRSIIACSLLKRHGLVSVRNITGGWNKIKEQKGIKTIKETAVLN